MPTTKPATFKAKPKPFGNAKRKGTLQHIMAKLAVTSRTVVAIGLMVLSLDAILRILRALIDEWSACQALCPPKYHALPAWQRSLPWICPPAMKLRAAV